MITQVYWEYEDVNQVRTRQEKKAAHLLKKIHKGGKVFRTTLHSKKPPMVSYEAYEAMRAQRDEAEILANSALTVALKECDRLRAEVAALKGGKK